MDPNNTLVPPSDWGVSSSNSINPFGAVAPQVPVSNIPSQSIQTPLNVNPFTFNSTPVFNQPVQKSVSQQNTQPAVNVPAPQEVSTSSYLINQNIPHTESKGDESQSFNFSSSGTQVIDSDSGVKKPSPLSGLLKLLILVGFPLALCIGAIVFTLVKSQETKYQASKNVVASIPMTEVNWQDLGVVFEPVIKVEIKTQKGFEEWEFLLDSGAVVSSLPRNWATKMGLDLAMMKRSTFQGFGNAKSFAYHGDMTFMLGTVEKTIPVVFTESTGTKSLLGRKGFFENYSVYFNHKEKTIEIRE